MGKNGKFIHGKLSSSKRVPYCICSKVGIFWKILALFWLFSEVDVWKHWKKFQKDFFDISNIWNNTLFEKTWFWGFLLICSYLKLSITLQAATYTLPSFDMLFVFMKHNFWDAEHLNRSCRLKVSLCDLTTYLCSSNNLRRYFFSAL